MSRKHVAVNQTVDMIRLRNPAKTLQSGVLLFACHIVDQSISD